MSRLKKMPLKIRRQLEKAARSIIIANGTLNGNHFAFICTNIGYKWLETNEAKIMKQKGDPFKAWWEKEKVNTRLMGIAIMLTMLEEILNHECTPTTQNK